MFRKIVKHMAGALAAISFATLTLSASAQATQAAVFETELKQPGRLLVAVYNDFPPYADQNKGLDVDVAEALANRLGLKLDIMSSRAGEDMSDDLRNLVWKGHYLNSRTADVMMHVPVDKVLQSGNPQVRIFGAYHRENIGIARDIRKVASVPGPAGLQAFTKEKIGVEGATISDAYLIGAFGGRLRENVVHFKTVKAASDALRKEDIAAVMAPITELEAALQGAPERIVIAPYGAQIVATDGWNLGMAVAKDNGQLAGALETAMAALVADGTIATIFKRHGLSYHKP